MTYAAQTPNLTHQGKSECGICGVWGHALSPRSCLLWALPPGSGQGPRPASVGALLPGTSHSLVLSLCQLLPRAGPLAPAGTWAAATAHSLPSCLPGTQLQGGSVTQRQVLERKELGVGSAPSTPCYPWLRPGLILTIPQTKAPASSLSHSVPAASPGPGSRSTALVLRMGIEAALQSVGGNGKEGCLRAGTSNR